MEDRAYWRLEGASDVGLQRELMQLLASGYRTEARIVAHIAEVDRRKLFLKEGFSSLYKYCKRRLGLSESEAFHRMTAAAIARKYPVAFDLLEQRKIHLSGLCKLRDFLTRANHTELLAEACGKTKQQVEQLLSVRFPGRKVRDSMRRLPAGRMIPTMASPPRVDSPPTGDGVESAFTRPRRGVEHPRGPGLGHSDSSESSSAPLFASRVEVFDPITGEVKSSLTGEGGSGFAGSQRLRSSDSSPSGGAGVADEPSLRQPRYRVQFDASSELKAKIDLARALSSHANRSGDLAVLFERAIELYVEQLQKKRFGMTDKPRSVSMPTRKTREQAVGANDSSSVAEGDSASDSKGVGAGSKQGRGHIPHETRREIVAKDGLRCAFVSPAGQRCDEQAFLQIHHEAPWARTKDDRGGNLRIYCAGHNRLRAEQDFGESYIARCIGRSCNPRDE